MSKTIKLAALAFVLVALSGCADSVSPTQGEHMTQVGFLHGLLHGMILPFAWIASLFDSSVAIYATYNNGGWYDFGFVLGCGALGSSSRTRGK